MSTNSDGRSLRKIAVLAAVGMIVLALGIAGGNATYAYLSDGETLGTAADPNVIAAGNLASERVASGVGNTGTTREVDDLAETETDTTAGTATTDPTETETTADTATPTETKTRLGTDTEPDTDTDAESDTSPSPDGERSCTGNTGAGNAGDDCTTASGLAVFGVPALAVIRREYALPVSRRGR